MCGYRFVWRLVWGLVMAPLLIGMQLSAQDEVELVLAFPSWIDPDNSVIQSVASEYQDMNPGTSVYIEIYPDYYTSYKDALRAMLAAGSGPDGIFVDADYLLFEQKEGFIVPINDYFDDTIGEFEQALQDFTNPSTGELLGVPFFNVPAMSIFDVNRMEEMGLSIQAQISIEELGGVIAALDVNGYKTAVSRDLTVASSFVRSGGANSDIFHNPSKEAWEEAILMQDDLSTVFEPASVYSPASFQELAVDMAGRSTALALDSTFVLPHIAREAPEINIGIAFIPYIDEQYTIAHGFAGAVGPFAENPQEVVNFYQFLAQHPLFVSQTLSLGGLPSHQAGFDFLYQNEGIVSEVLLPSLLDDLPLLEQIARTADQANGSPEMSRSGYSNVLQVGVELVHAFINEKQPMIIAAQPLAAAIASALQEGQQDE